MFQSIRNFLVTPHAFLMTTQPTGFGSLLRPADSIGMRRVNVAFHFLLASLCWPVQLLDEYSRLQQIWRARPLGRIRLGRVQGGARPNLLQPRVPWNISRKQFQINM